MGLFSRDKSPLRDPAPTQYLPQYTAEASYSSTPRYQTRFASMSIHQEDEVRFLHFPDAVVNLCRATASTWHKGMKGEKEYGGSVEFKFHGHPWRGGNEESLEAARLMNGFLRTLHSQGWILALSTDVSKKMYDKDTLLFRHQSPPPAESDWCSIVFSKTDRLRLVDVSPEVASSLVAKIGPAGVKEHSVISPGVFEIKLGGGFSWWADGTDTMKVRGMLLTLMETLDEEGWSVYASVDQKINYNQYASNADCWHCCRPRGWVRGTPVYHG